MNETGQRQLEADIEVEKQLLAQDDDFASPKRAQATVREIVDYCESRGISKERLAGVYDHETVLLLRDAARYGRAEAERRQHAEATRSKLADARARFAKSGGDLRAAGKVWGIHLDNGLGKPAPRGKR